MMAGRRGNNEGSIFKRKTCHECKKVSSGEEKALKVCKYCAASLPSEGLWVGVATVGIDLVTGKPKRPTFYGQTRAEVAGKLAEAVQQAKTGQYIEPTKTTLGEWLDRWLTAYKKGRLGQATYESYSLLIRVHIQPALGHVVLSKLQPSMLQTFYNDKLAAGRVDGTGGLSTRTVRYLHTVIRQALSQAAKEGLLARNVADATSPPTVRNKPMRPLTEDQLTTLLAHMKDDRLFAALLLAATTGLRRGELLGLCWDCVDLERGEIIVKRQLVVRQAGAVLVETTKTQRGRRTVALTDDALRELKAHRKRQLQEKLFLGEAYRDSGLVFCLSDGRWVDPNNFDRSFKKALAVCGLPHVRIHDLRHGHATMLLQRGVHAKLVQDRLGHSSIKMTLDLYSHVTPEMQRTAAESLSGLFPNVKSPSPMQGATRK